MNVPQTARARVRAELTGEIVAAASRALARDGAAALSLRAVARDLGMAPSALYRYFANRDDLLTALITNAYMALGTELRRAGEGVPRRSFRRRFLATARSLRAWAFGHPHEWALLYGSPVPGYHAPERTVPPALDVWRAVLASVEDAAAAGALRGESLPPVPPSVRASLAPIAEGLPTSLDPPALMAVLAGAMQLFGAINLDLFGHLAGGVDDPEVLYGHLAGLVADRVGLGA